MPIRAVLFSLFLSFFLVTANAVAKEYDLVEGEVSTSLPPSPLDIIVGGHLLQSAGGEARMIYEDGSTAKYFDAAPGLKEDIRINGPRRVIVYKNLGGPSFDWVRILPRAPRR